MWAAGSGFLTVSATAETSWLIKHAGGAQGAVQGEPDPGEDLHHGSAVNCFDWV